MPAIRRQEILADGFLIETTEFGVLQVSIIKSGSQYTLTVRRDGGITRQVVVASPTLAQVESSISTELDTRVRTTGGRLAVNIGFHLVTLDPLVLQIQSSNDPLPANWWQSS